MRTKNTFSILFFLRTSRGKNKRAAIYARITVNGQRTEISTKCDVEATAWNAASGMAKGTRDEIKELNTYLEHLRGKIFSSYQDLLLRKKAVTAEGVKNNFLGIEEEQHSLGSLMDFHNSEMKSVLEWGTLKNYLTTAKLVRKYLKEKFRLSDILLTELNYKFIFGFEQFCKNHKPEKKHFKPCGHNTALKHIERLRKMTNLAIKHEWLEKDPFIQYKSSFLKTERGFLTADELATVEEKQFSFPRLDFVRDLFVFACYTGIAYMDVMNLSRDNVSLGIDSNTWIFYKRVKTKKSSSATAKVPLLHKALEILKKYERHPLSISRGTLFPSISNQKLNSYLKEIADLCGINKNLTFHLARHTFATTVTLSNGVPIETVSKMLGHTSIRTTQIYAKVIEKKISDDMNRLKEVLTQAS
jgi:integrase/recombinase XerD